MSVSVWQILIVLLIVLLLFGPSRIPGLGKSLGQAIRGFKKGISDDDEIDVTESTKSDKINSQKSSTEEQKSDQKHQDKV